jgi:hypothetical protein
MFCWKTFALMRIATAAVNWVERQIGKHERKVT